jgi:uncharacterized iron-regulated membrane protein
MSFWKRPQTVWWRKVTFQVHLWAGLILGLYLLVIDVTGSILVVKGEIQAWLYPQFVKAVDIGNLPVASADAALKAAKDAFPKYVINAAYAPGTEIGNWVMIGTGERTQRYIFVDRAGRYMGSLDLRKQWLLYVALLHENLLLGRTGRIINGLGGIALLLIAVSGLVIWWPGVARWTRALFVNFRGSWKRINFDLHSAIGIWTIVFLGIWAFTAIYFAWPEQFRNAVSVISLAKNKGLDINITTPAKGSRMVSLAKLEATARAYAKSPGAMAGYFFPFKPTDTMTMILATSSLEDDDSWDYVYLNPYTGEALGVWHRGASVTLGDHIMVLIGPLHFGTDWGLAVKLIWFAAGMGLPVLFLTGALMYWNRTLSRKWKVIRSKRTAPQNA